MGGTRMPVAWADEDGDPTHYEVVEAGRMVPPCACRECLRRCEMGVLVARIGRYEAGIEAIRGEIRRRS